VKLPALSAASCLILLCGCKPAPAPAPRVTEQKMDVLMPGFDDMDKKAMNEILSGELSLGWEVTAATYDSKRDRVIVFFKKVN